MERFDLLYYGDCYWSGNGEDMGEIKELPSNKAQILLTRDLMCVKLWVSSKRE